MSEWWAGDVPPSMTEELEMSDRRPENSDQMVEAVQRQMAHAQRSAYVDRREWTDDQWIADARRLMNDIDGAITSLVNGHVMAMLRRLDELTEPEGDCAEDCQRHASCRPQATVPADLLAPPEGLVKVWVEDEEFGEHWQASIRPADLIAAARRGVESGTIKGWRIPQFCTHHLLNTQRLSVDYCPKGASLLAEGAPVTCKLIEVLVVPVSDGGSET